MSTAHVAKERAFVKSALDVADIARMLRQQGLRARELRANADTQF